MNKEQVKSEIKKLGLLAVIRGPSPEMTIQMVDALLMGGVSGIEITYSTPKAEDVARILADRYGDRLLLGMGTLTKIEQVESAKFAGAQFLVSPVCEEHLIGTMLDSGLLTMAGALTPTEIFRAYRIGADIVKVFPGSLAGPDYIKALKGPFPEIPLMPTGGVNLSNVGDWFRVGVVAVGVGSELCPPQLAREGKFGEITRLAEEFVNAIREAKG